MFSLTVDWYLSLYSAPVTSEKENVCEVPSATSDILQPESGAAVSSTATPLSAVLPITPAIPGCRFCGGFILNKIAHKTCHSCNALILNFVNKCSRLDELTCIRDLRCSSRWTAEWNTCTNVKTKYKDKLLEQYGPIVGDWCVPCKITHCVKLGCRLLSWVFLHFVMGMLSQPRDPSNFWIKFCNFFYKTRS